jgi:hypothetical protein
MEIFRISALTGVARVKDLDVTQEQLDLYENMGVLLQDAFPHLSDDDREFIKTGITPEEWDDALYEDR